ncbi:MAG: tetratricopeptide repeat protein [Oligoflexia bacterium]|nr:tetratricopeptide repeat protein [Oligoflexia bacterium]MBF0366123.1 tetratricopeptide repeat protein [Oligoflexia bacterium]
MIMTTIENVNSIGTIKSIAADVQKLLYTTHYDPAQAGHHLRLGNAYYQQKAYSLSRFHYEKALTLGEQQNLELKQKLIATKEILGVTINQEMRSTKDQLLDHLKSLSADTFTSSSLLILNFLLMMAILTRKKYLAYPLFHKKPHHFYGALAMLLVISFSPLFFHRFYLKNTLRAITLDATIVYEGPSKIFSEKQTIDPGYKIIVRPSLYRWAQIVAPASQGAQNGWVQLDTLGIF